MSYFTTNSSLEKKEDTLEQKQRIKQEVTYMETT